WGLAMRAVRDSEIAAGSMGVDPLAVRALAFTLSVVLAGIAGSFYAATATFVTPSAFAFFQSILFVLVVMIGGAERTYGPVIGAAIVVALPEALSSFAEYRVLFFGALLLVVLWIAPGGVAGLAAQFGRKRRPPAAEIPRAAALAAVTGAPLVVRGLSIKFGGLRAVDDLAF